MKIGGKGQILSIKRQNYDVGLAELCNYDKMGKSIFLFVGRNHLEKMGASVASYCGGLAGVGSANMYSH